MPKVSRIRKLAVLLLLLICIGVLTRGAIWVASHLLPGNEVVVERVFGWIGGLIAVVAIVVPLFKHFNLFRDE